MKSYRRIAGVTVGAVIFLILIGALVRMTGSGMGCPDWPKCFGQWVPPTDVSQLPADYKERFRVAGEEIADFDAFKTWVEYLNRLIGVLIGLFSIATAVAGWRVRRQMPRVAWLSILSLVVVIIQGGIGAYVVRTNLHTGMITLHMMIALFITALLIWALIESYRPALGPAAGAQVPGRLRLIAWGGVGVMVAQIILGTQVREGVDVVAKATGEAGRDRWIEMLGLVYEVHSLFYYAVALMLGLLIWQIRPWLGRVPGTGPLVWTLILTVVGEIALGLGMHHLGMPAWMQPLHLLGATLMFAAAFALAGVLSCYRQALGQNEKTGPVLVATGA